MRHVAASVLVLLWFVPLGFAAEGLRVGTFEVDASPPVGSPLAYDSTKAVQMPLSCRGLVLRGAGEPIVLCVVDWIGIGNDGYRLFREGLAEAVGTTPERVAVHTVHQHDAPRCDFSVEKVFQEYGIEPVFDADFARDVIRRAAEAAKAACDEAAPVTHLGLGAAEVDRVASNRRIIGPDGKVIYNRTSATKAPKIRAYPVGTIDPMLKMITLYNGQQPLVALTYYATHPQSYYRTGLANPDFPGMARNSREAETGVRHIHFNGAGGNIAAGKWNDGNHKNRQILADRMAAAMRAAWENTQRTPLTAEDVAWTVLPVALPPAAHLNEASLIDVLESKESKPVDCWNAANGLAWLRRCQRGETIDLQCLALGDARVLFMPGELFVEYQLAAQKMRPDLFVAMAAYGDYTPGYICTEIAYDEGGYEPSQRASRVAPGVESVLMDAMRELLGRP